MEKNDDGILNEAQTLDYLAKRNPVLAMDYVWYLKAKRNPPEHITRDAILAIMELIFIMVLMGLLFSLVLP